MPLPVGLEARALARIRAAVAEKRFTQRELGRACGYKDAGIGLILAGRRSLPFEVVQAAADILRIDPAELLADPKSEVRALTPPEAEFLRMFRVWPGAIRTALLTFLQHFASEDGLEEQYRTALGHLRHMGRTERNVAFAYLLLLSEGRLPPDIRAKLEPEPTPAGSIDAMLRGLSAAERRPVLDVAQKAALAHRRRMHAGARARRAVPPAGQPD